MHQARMPHVSYRLLWSVAVAFSASLDAACQTKAGGRAQAALNSASAPTADGAPHTGEAAAAASPTVQQGAAVAGAPAHALRRVVLVVRSTGLQGAPVDVWVNGEWLGQLQNNGSGHFAWRALQGQDARVVLDTTPYPALEPSSPQHDFVIATEDTLLLVDQPFRVRLPELGTHPAESAPPARPPAVDLDTEVNSS